jgi:hypothetical protein
LIRDRTGREEREKRGVEGGREEEEKLEDVKVGNW